MDYLTLAAALAPSLYKGISGLVQGDKADEVKLRDTTPAGFTESVNLGRQAAAAQAPGTGQALARIEGTQNATLGAAVRAGTSGQTIQALLEQSDANRQQALAGQLARSDAYHQQAGRNLQGLLGQQAAYQQRDLATFDANRAALRESSQRNLYGALDGASQAATYFLTKPDAASADATAAAATGTIPAYPPGVNEPYGSPYSRRSYRYGVLDPTGGFAPAGSY